MPEANIHPAEVPEGGGQYSGPEDEEAVAPQEDTSAADRGAFLTAFGDLPSVVRAREQLLERGYSEDDPIMVIIEAMALYDKRQEVLSGRIITAFANSVNASNELRDEVAGFRGDFAAVLNQIDELSVTLERSQDQASEVSKQFGTVLKSNGEYIPFLERAGREIEGAAKLIENRSTTAVVLSYLAPAAALIAGLLIGLMLH